MINLTPLGITNWRNSRTPFYIKDSDRSGHIYCIGKTGTGKSTLLLNMAIHDIQTGKGIGIIDPHGDLAEEILNHIPENRIQDVVYFNTTDTEYPVAYNPLYKVPRESQYLIASCIVTALKKIWADSWGPRLEHILRHAVLSLAANQCRTLLDIAPMLTDFEFRKKVLFSVDDKAIHQFWEREFEPLSIQLKNEVIAPILNKVGLLSTHPILRNMLGQGHSAFSVAGLMDKQKIFIANLSKGSLGEEGTQLLGSLLITEFQVAALRRNSQAVEKRNPFYLFIDEAHSFMTLSFADILSESRKYGLCLFLTHQYIEQLQEEIRTAVFGNTGTLICFRVGATDAEYLEKEFYPVFDREDIINLPRYSMYLKIMIDGTTSRPFSAESLPAPETRFYLKGYITEISRKKYAREIEIVEKTVPGGHSGNRNSSIRPGLFDA